MQKNLNNFIYNLSPLLVISCFAVSVLLRSATINLYFIVLSLIFLINTKNYKNVTFKNWHILFFLFIVYCCIISIFAENKLESFKSSVSQIRFLLFIFFISSLKINEVDLRKFINFTACLVILVCLDTFYQYFVGHDIFGFMPGNPLSDPNRLSGPFDQELIVGAFIYLTSIPLIAFYLNDLSRRKIKEKFFILAFIILVFFSILISGERMAFILFLTSLSILTVINFDFKKILIFFSIVVFALILTFKLNTSVNYRVSNFVDDLSNFKKSNHFKIFVSAIDIWKNNKAFGVGLKNFRVMCDKNKMNSITKEKNVCSSHPHNLYFELISETGTFGLVIFLVFVILVLKYIYNISYLIDKKFYGIFTGCALIVIMHLWPIKSSGSLFTTFTASFFWFNLGIICLIANNKNN